MAVELAYLEGRWQGVKPLFEASDQAREQLCMVRMLVHCPDADTWPVLKHVLASQCKIQYQQHPHRTFSVATEIIRGDTSGS